MAYDLQKRLVALQEQAEQAKYRCIKPSTALFCSCLVLVLFVFITRANPKVNDLVAAMAIHPFGTADNTTFEFEKEDYAVIERLNNYQRSKASEAKLEPTESKTMNDLLWFLSLRQQVIKRTQFLKLIPFFDSAARSYYNYAVKRTAPHFYGENSSRDPFQNNSLASLVNRVPSSVFDQFMLSCILRLGFVVYAFWPFWLIAAVLGFVLIRYFHKKKKFDPILTICDRGKGPFYSGVYGPFRLNGSYSGMDLACPGLACPEMLPKKSANNHQLVRILRTFDAFNETTFSLVRMILAYRDFPYIVDEERPVEEDSSFINKPKLDTSSPDVGLATNTSGTIEGNSLEVLPALLSAHKTLRRYFRTKSPREDRKDSFSAVYKDLEQFATKLPVLAKTLLFVATPDRARALADLTPKALACAYLALEAGKSLVYKRSDHNYVKMSQFPHLQARAVLHSIPTYHTEFDGDTRLIIRQAIICSRRHGDFARSFLPENMPISSRALRDILEVLYAPKEKREDIALIVELDAYTEEILQNWRTNFVEHIEALERQTSENKINNKSFHLSKGIVYKSVVLVPQKNLIEIALKSFSHARLQRISELMQHARRFRKSLAISARLPGFKRQIDESEESYESDLENNKAKGATQLEQWHIVRRMLTRYNWLSTRVGDDAVPSNGLVHGVVIDRLVGEKIEVVGFDALVPLRQRRVREILGNQWERNHYLDSPHPNDIAVFVSHEHFEKDLTRKIELASKGLLDSVETGPLTKLGN